MSIRSMTGFGRAAFTLGAVAYAVEVRSVNHRYLDVKVRAPRVLVAAEAALRAAVGARLARGRVEVLVQSVAGEDAQPQTLIVDHALARAVHAAHAEIAEALGVPLALDTAALVAWPGVLQGHPAEIDDDEASAAACAALSTALDALVEMRAREGAALLAVLEAHLEAVADLRVALAARAPEQSVAYRARLKARVGELLEGLDIAVDEGRILHELAVFGERTDVAEELARLHAHLGQARALLADPGAEGSGRRLDFLCQEMFREANTIASKVDDVALSTLTIGLKAELERLREQVQNVE